LSWHHMPRSLTSSLKAVASLSAYHCCVISKLNDGVGVVLGHTVVGEQGVQEGTKHTNLRGPSVEEQRGRCVVAYPYRLGATHLWICWGGLRIGVSLGFPG
jgi:hypothetical protein